MVLQAGDRAAFDTLVRQYDQGVLRMVLRVAGSADEADDVEDVDDRDDTGDAMGSGE